MTVETIRADYGNDAHAQHVIDLLDAYARDPMGGSTPLDADVCNNLIPALAAMPTAFSVLAFVDEVAVGLANCFEGFSTFACKPLINIHDVVAHPDFRGQGVGRALMGEVEAIAREKGCCKITLEVLTGNGPAMGLYRDLGYSDYVLDPVQGAAVFWQKKL
jgi:ribosomal protein S18 acetylase RimI-like enzyme